MYEDEVQQLPTQAGSSHFHFRDVLQTFVQDFSLRQAAGEGRIREIERQLSDANGEIHLLRRLLEEYQTKLNDDNVLITRLHHEIEALQGRVSHIDRKNTQTEALSSRLELRLDHLKECLTQTCSDTQKGVSKLLGNFAKVHFSGNFDKKEDFQSSKETKAQEISVRRKNVPTFAQANYSDGSGSENMITKSNGDFDLQEEPERTHSTYSRQSSATKSNVCHSSAEHEYINPTNDASMTNECPSTDMPITNDMNPTTAERLPSPVPNCSANDTNSRQFFGDPKTGDVSNSTSTEGTSSFQDGSNSTNEVPSKTARDGIGAVGRSDGPGKSAHLPPAIVVPHGLPKGKKGPKGQGKNKRYPRTTSLSEEHGRSDKRPRTTSLTEEQSSNQQQRRTASFCEDQLHCNRKDHPTGDCRKELYTGKKQHTHTFASEQSKPNRQDLNVNQEYGNANRKNRTVVNEQKSKNTKEPKNTQGSEGQAALETKEQPGSSGENNEQASSSKNIEEQASSQGNKEQFNVQACKEQATYKGNQEQVNHRNNKNIAAKANEEQTTSHSNNKQANKKGKETQENKKKGKYVNKDNEKHTNKDNEEIVSKGNEELVNKGNDELVNKGNEERVNKGNEERVNKGNEELVSKSNEELVNKGNEELLHKGNEENVNKGNEENVNKGNEEHVNKSNEELVNKVSEELVNKVSEELVNKGKENHVHIGNENNVNKENEEIVNKGTEELVNKGNEELVNMGNERNVNTGNEKHVNGNEKRENKGNEKYVNTGNEELVKKGNEELVNKIEESVNKDNEELVNKSNEKHVRKGNQLANKSSKELENKDNEELVNKGNEFVKSNEELVSKSNEKPVSKGNEKHVNKDNELVNKSNKKLVNKGNEKHVKKGNEGQLNKNGNEKDGSLKGNAEQAVTPDQDDKVFPKNSEHQVFSHRSVEHGVAQDSEKPVISSSKEEQVNEQPQGMNTEELKTCQSTEEQVAIHSTEEQLKFWISEEQTQNSEQTPKITENQTFQRGKDKDEALVKGASSENGEEITHRAIEERRTPSEERTNHSNNEEKTTSQNSTQHTPTVSESESSQDNANCSEHPPDEATSVAATERSPKVGTARQRKAKNKEEARKVQENAKHSSAKDEEHLPGLRRRSFRMDGEEDQQEQEVGMCANCGFLAKLRCASCRQAFYCKRECQREHWKKGHKDQCQPFQIMESAELGRFMVASRDLKAGDVILKEEPLVVGPKQITEPLCLGCYSKVDGSYRCQKCQWPLCGPECERCPDHQPECVVGQEIGSPIEITNYHEPNHFYEVVFTLRCLALKKKAPKKYEQLQALESHYEDRKGTHVHRENQKRIVNFLRNYFFIQEFPIEDIDSSERSIHNITGIIDVNALELRLKESEVLGLYPTFAMLEHSCTPNTKHAFNKDRQVVLKAAVDIKRGEHISTMYTHILWGTAARRDHLKHSKYFMCSCFRCSDPTELGTHFSALRCKQCSNGFLLSAAPLDELASWICTSCNATLASEDVTEVNLKLGEEVEGLLAMPNREALEGLIQRHGKSTVHPNHFHLFAARHTLLQMYGRDPNSADEASMKKKEKMCQDFLKVCTALDPGMSRLAPYAGVALYEYHLAVLARARQDPEAKQVDSAALKKDVETAKALLQQCIRVLQDEPSDQPEGQLCHVAQQNLAELRQWEATLS